VRWIWTGAMTALLLAGCGPTPTALSTPAVDTVAAGKLTACTNLPYEPFELLVDDKESGIDIDLVQALAEDLGKEAAFHRTSFDTIFDELDGGACDLVASAVSITEERRQKYLFSDGYFEINQSLMVRASDVRTIGDLGALTGRKIGVLKGTTGADYAASHATDAKLVKFDDAHAMVDALTGSQVDAVLQDFPVNSYYARRSGALAVVTTFSDVEREQYGFAMAQRSSALRDAVNGSLQRIRQDGRYDEILRKYLGAATE
jgi:polar amino acid transport system substrate-binding protein